ncbi:MAG: helix-turn-helix transcriptional regulator [Dehalococcoidia bacterium]|nr:helix-turn-helix transcriptional regulator [Dehalococcoidia bacterium]
MTEAMTAMEVWAGDFSPVFFRLLEETEITIYQISQYTHLDQAYLHRLKTGERRNPSPATVIKITLAFAHLSAEFGIRQAERLFKSIGRTISIRD